MKKKIKLRDLTEEQYWKYNKKGCYTTCDKCMFRLVNCTNHDENCWIHHKDLYSDKFLDQEIEIEVEPIFTDKEREYLHNLLKPFKDRITTMQLVSEIYNNDFAYLQISIKSVISPYDTKNIEFINLPYFETGTMYKNLEVNKPYTDDELKELLKELELL